MNTMTGPAIDAALDACSTSYLPRPDALASTHELRQYLAHVECERDRAFAALRAVLDEVQDIRQAERDLARSMGVPA